MIRIFITAAEYLFRCCRFQKSMKNNRAETDPVTDIRFYLDAARRAFSSSFMVARVFLFRLKIECSHLSQTSQMNKKTLATMNDELNARRVASK